MRYWQGKRLWNGEYASPTIDTYHDDQTGGQNPMSDDEKVDTLVLGDFIDVCTMGDLRRARTAHKGGDNG